ncbi:hypothetical protein KCU81_g256, partial [Aureobasidium melanogenum]
MDGDLSLKLDQRGLVDKRLGLRVDGVCSICVLDELDIALGDLNPTIRLQGVPAPKRTRAQSSMTNLLLSMIVRILLSIFPFPAMREPVSPLCKGVKRAGPRRLHLPHPVLQRPTTRALCPPAERSTLSMLDLRLGVRLETSQPRTLETVYTIDMGREPRSERESERKRCWVLGEGEVDASTVLFVAEAKESDETRVCRDAKECLGPELENLERTTTGHKWAEGGYLDLVSPIFNRLGTSNRSSMTTGLGFGRFQNSRRSDGGCCQKQLRRSPNIRASC